MREASWKAVAVSCENERGGTLFPSRDCRAAIRAIREITSSVSLVRAVNRTTSNSGLLLIKSVSELMAWPFRLGNGIPPVKYILPVSAEGRKL